MLKHYLRHAEINQYAVSNLYGVVIIKVFEVLYLSKLIRHQESLQLLYIITVDFFEII